MWGRLSSRAVCRVIRSAFLGASVALLLTGAAHGGETFRVIDGDGIELAGQSVRLWGIDAPELRQECSKDGRRELLRGKGERGPDGLPAGCSAYLRNRQPGSLRAAGR